MVVLYVQYTDAPDRTNLTAWSCGGKHAVVNQGHDPFFYAVQRPSPHRLKSWDRVASMTERQMRLLSTGKMSTVYRVATRRSWDVPAVSKDVQGVEKISCYENHVYYENRFIIDCGFVHDDIPPVFMSFDVEVLPPDEFSFPHAARDPITSIAARSSNYDRMCWCSESDELSVLEGFRDYFKLVNPDVIFTYYGDTFDYPYLFNRMKHWHVADFLTRIHGSPCFKRERGQDEMWEIPGRCNFDLQYEVRADQGLYGLKNRTLKTVGAHFRKKKMIEAFQITMPEGIYRTVRRKGINILPPYNMADVNTTYEMGTNIYYPLVESLARDILKCDLQHAVWRSPYWFSETLLGRRFEEAGILCDGTNEERFPDAFEFINENIEERNVRPQGALCALMQRGVFRKVKKFDYKSMYPSIIRAHNLSPETVHFVKLTRNVDYPGWFARYVGDDDKCRTAELYDANLRCIWCITIDKVPGILPTYEKELMEMRDRERKEKKPGWQARQLGLKVTGNTLFGNQRLGFSGRGNVMVNLAIMAFGRQHSLKAIAIMRACGAVILEIDTDGMYFTWDGNIEALIAVINACVPITMDYEDEWGTGMFYKPKNYILKSEGKDPVVHGISLKGSNRPRMCDKVVKALAELLHAGKDPLEYVHGLSLDSYDPDDFMITNRLNKEIGDYATNTPTKRLAIALENRGNIVRVSDEFTYFWTVVSGKSEPITASDWHTGQYQFDRKKYADLLGKSVARVIGPLYFTYDNYSKLTRKGEKEIDRPLLMLGRAIRDYLLGKAKFDAVEAATGAT